MYASPADSKKLQDVLKGVSTRRLTYIDDRDGVDFCIKADRSRIGILEVIRSTDEDWRRLQAQLKDFKPLNADTEGEWSLDLDGTHGPGDIAKTLKSVGEHIRSIEEAGQDHFQPALPSSTTKKRRQAGRRLDE